MGFDAYIMDDCCNFVIFEKFAIKKAIVTEDICAASQIVILCRVSQPLSRENGIYFRTIRSIFQIIRGREYRTGTP